MRQSMASGPLPHPDDRMVHQQEAHMPARHYGFTQRAPLVGCRALLLLNVIAWLVPVTAREVIEDAGAPGFPADPAFAGSSAVALDNTLPDWNLDMHTLVIRRDGVTFTFTTDAV